MVNAGALRYVLSCAASGPGLLVAEDVHWYDPSTLELLDAVLMARDDSLLVVLTGRDGSLAAPTLAGPAVRSGSTGSAGLRRAGRRAVPGRHHGAKRLTVRYRCDGAVLHRASGRDVACREPARRRARGVSHPLFTQLNTRSAALPVLEAAAIIGRSGDIPLLGAVLDPATALPQHLDDVVGEPFEARVLETQRDRRLAVPARTLPGRRGRDIAAQPTPGPARPHRRGPCGRAWRPARLAVVAEHYAQAERLTDAVAGYRKVADAAPARRPAPRRSAA